LNDCQSQNADLVHELIISWIRERTWRNKHLATKVLQNCFFKLLAGEYIHSPLLNIYSFEVKVLLLKKICYSKMLIRMEL
jgi:hypothetical protein